MKGQYITLEYIIFFAIGVMIVIMVYGLFFDINKLIEEDITKSQLKSVTSLITGAIVNTFEVSNNTDSNIYYNLSIPTRVSNCLYSIIITPAKKIRLECSHDRGLYSEAPLYNFNIVAKNILYSTRGMLTISSKKGTIELS